MSARDFPIPFPRGRGWDNEYRPPVAGEVLARLQRDLDRSKSHPFVITGYVHRNDVIGDNEVEVVVDGKPYTFGVDGDFTGPEDDNGDRKFVATAVYATPATNLMALLPAEALEAIALQGAAVARENER